MTADVNPSFASRETTINFNANGQVLKSVKAAQEGVPFMCQIGTNSIPNKLTALYLREDANSTPPTFTTISGKQVFVMPLQVMHVPLAVSGFSGTFFMQICLLYLKSMAQSSEDKLLVRNQKTGGFITPESYSWERFDVGDYYYERGTYGYSVSYPSVQQLFVELGNEETKKSQILQVYHLNFLK